MSIKTALLSLLSLYCKCTLSFPSSFTLLAADSAFYRFCEFSTIPSDIASCDVKLCTVLTNWWYSLSFDWYVDWFASFSFRAKANVLSVLYNTSRCYLLQRNRSVDNVLHSFCKKLTCYWSSFSLYLHYSITH